VIVETVKPAEDGSGDVVLRLYESMRTATRCAVSLSELLPTGKAALTNMLEEFETAIEIKDNKVALDFGPFEIKTIRLSE
jgi:alpha-mannosidase